MIDLALTGELHDLVMQLAAKIAESDAGEQWHTFSMNIKTDGETAWIDAMSLRLIEEDA